MSIDYENLSSIQIRAAIQLCWSLHAKLCENCEKIFDWNVSKFLLGVANFYDDTVTPHGVEKIREAILKIYLLKNSRKENIGSKYKKISICLKSFLFKELYYMWIFSTF